MVIAPHIRATAHTDDGVPGIRLDIEIPRDLYYFAGHFPDCPLLPGVVQVTWAIEFARRYLSVTGEFRGVSGLKFMRVIQPGHLIELQLSFAAATGQLQFEYRNASGVCASGAVSFAP